MIISCENIVKSYNDLKALNGISFEVAQGEIFGFIGPDGAGKTSLFRILTTLLLPDSGKAMVDGLDVIRDFRKVRRIIGYMPGRFSLYSDLSVEENLQFFATVFGTGIRDNYHLIRDIYVQIEPFKKRLAGKLSGGMKQKLALSCALIHQPRLLVLDEPTTGVDAVSRREFWDLLLGLKAKGITILVSTPYMDEADMCDRIALIQKGGIMAAEKPGEIVKRFQKSIYALRSERQYQMLKDLREFNDTGSVFPFGQVLHYTGKGQSADETKLRDYLNGKGHANVRIEKIEPGIEDVFMSLMNKMETTPITA